MLDLTDTGMGQLRVNELHSFVVLTEELHFARAARRLRLTPGGLSRRISHLENTLGTRLLDRTTHCIGLTSDGIRLVPAIRQLVDEVQALHQTTAS